MEYHFLSACQKAAQNAIGEIFEVGETVGHDGAPGESATISSFYIDGDLQVIAQTSLGSANIDHLLKIKSEEYL